MRAAQPIEHVARRLGTARLHVRESTLERLNRFYPVEQLLVRFRILNDDFGAPVNRQDERVASPLESTDQLAGLSLEVAQ